MTPSFFLLLDDIAAVLDDVALLSKVAAKKTAGVLGDDLALNALQVSGVSADRELPVVWAVAKGSMINKAILVPCALALSIWAPFTIQPLLVLGGLYLCFEGAEKIAEKLFHRTSKPDSNASLDNQLQMSLARQKLSANDLVLLEKEKIQGAIRTDFILSAEIIVIALGSVAQAGIVQQIGTLIAISIAMTLGVYGLVAGIVKIDDLGLYFLKRSSIFLKKLGSALLIFAPLLMKFLSVIGTAAMFTVGGGILIHAWHFAHDLIQNLPPLLFLITELCVGLGIGLLVVGANHSVRFIFKKRGRV